jgi:hypothetical protein
MQPSDLIKSSVSVRKPEKDQALSLYFNGSFEVLAMRKTDQFYSFILKNTSSIFFISLPRMFIAELKTTPKEIMVSEKPDTRSKVIKPIIDAFTGQDFIISSHDFWTFDMFSEVNDSDLYTAIDSRHGYEIGIAFTNGRKRYVLLNTKWCGYVLKEVHLDAQYESTWKGALAHPENYCYQVGTDEKPLTEFFFETKG